MESATQASSSWQDPAGPPQVSQDLSGKTLGEFRLQHLLGQGGMGQVYVAEQTSLKRKVAIKVMRNDVAVSATSFQRFKAEAEAIARITHANIVQVYAFGEEAGLHYMALEFVEGRNLREFLAKKGSPDLPLALSIMRQVASALQRATELGIIHRDIKPENILLTKRGEVKVADFGLARCFAGEQSTNLTQTGVALGTPLYMSPEQVQGLPVDPRTDIYSFGVSCYHMLAGHPPFRGQTSFELALQHVRADAVPLTSIRPDLPPQLCLIIHKMMAKEVDKRYQNCAELLGDLAALRDTLGNQKTQASGQALLPSFVNAGTPSATIPLTTLRRSWLPIVAGGSIGVALIAGGALAWLKNRPQAGETVSLPAAVSPQPELSEQQKQERFLRDAVEQYASPGGDRDKLEMGLRHRLELGLFYLQYDRLDDGADFFGGLTNPAQKIEAYRTLGRLGQAIVLAHKDQARESNEQFLALINARARDGKPPDRLPFLINHPKLRYEISRALEQNKANSSLAPFPARLDDWRNPPKWIGPQQGDGKRGGLGKQTGKSN